MDKEKREKLIENFAQRCVEDMDIDTLMEIVGDQIIMSLKNDDDADVIAKIGNCYPELLED